MASKRERLIRQFQRMAEDDNPDTRLIPGFGGYRQGRERQRAKRNRVRPRVGRQTTPRLNRYPGFPSSNRYD